MARQGNVLIEAEIRRIVNLLSSTDMSLSEISERMGCSRSAVASINRKFNVRHYSGRRSHWTIENDQNQPVFMEA